MLLNKNSVVIFSFCFLLVSCGGTTRNLSSGQFSKTEKYTIKSYYGCCGCAAEYFNIYNGSVWTEQLVYKYNCYSTGMPTKFIFNYDEYGQLLYCNKLVATSGDDFDDPLTSNERNLFLFLDKDKILVIGDNYIKYSTIKGFRKLKPGDISHPFPLIKGGGGTKIKIK
jgi:hypothetical protein